MPANSSTTKGRISASEDEDSEYDTGLSEARAARFRVSKNREKRDEKRKIVEAEYANNISSLEDRINDVYSEYHKQVSILYETRFRRLAEAIEKRDLKQNEIASKLKDIQQRTENFSAQLLALYDSRLVDVSQVEMRLKADA